MRGTLVLLTALAAIRTHAFTVPTNKVGLFKPQSALSMTIEGSAAKKIRVGVIGCGRIGIVHLGAITKAPNVTPVIVSNPTVSKAEKGKRKKNDSFLALV